MKVYWLEQAEADVPTGNDWLGLSEANRLNGLRFAKRRADWRLGRWTAKRALAACLDLPAHLATLARIEIIPAASGAPEAFVAHKRAPVTISLSHRGGRAMCTVAPSGAELGCDLEIVEPRSDAFVNDYFAREEQKVITLASPAERSLFAALLWSAKESALKALREGLRMDTRDVIVCLLEGSCGSAGWTPLQVRCANGQIFHGWSRNRENIVRTVVANPPPDPPLYLNLQASHREAVAFDIQTTKETKVMSTVHL
jgi:4'-phosphopantetheinyl transferase